MIADAIHVHPAAMKILLEVKGPERVILVTDATRGTGMPDGEYRLDRRTIIVHDGAARLPDGTLAGSMLTMDRAPQNILQATGRSMREVWPTTSLNAARAIGLSASKGSLEVGKDADLALLDTGLNIGLTVAQGAIVYHSQPTQRGKPAVANCQGSRHRDAATAFVSVGGLTPGEP